MPTARVPFFPVRGVASDTNSLGSPTLLNDLMLVSIFSRHGPQKVTFSMGSLPSSQRQRSELNLSTTRHLFLVFLPKRG